MIMHKAMFKRDEELGGIDSYDRALEKKTVLKV